MHMSCGPSDSPKLVQSIFKGRYRSGGIECDVLPMGDRRIFLYQLELFHASFCTKPGLGLSREMTDTVSPSWDVRP